MRQGKLSPRSGGFVFFLVAGCLLPAGQSIAGEKETHVLHVVIEDAITPVTSRHIVDAIRISERRDDAAVARAAERNSASPGGRGEHRGFRVARSH